MRLIRLSFCLSLAACTQFPELADSEGPAVDAAPYPRLLSVEELAAVPEATTSTALAEGLLARIRGLEARTARLRRPAIDRGTRARMARGVGEIVLPE
ncbi:MAG: hypothetical protein RID15_01690 [Marinovum algicola]|jgi:hypothetical protein|uniref:Uncharacterized protein n=1 Tax=Marinovum algicola TaxID=42444 RepID=A0A975W836_9RHOB|nr:hypothetical protein [Marinovum algicola]SEI96636.1 hypothetical protein SAMN04487940_102505 [Marinovum algicola]SLN09903.1 hypothetical protein MAA5396_00008 [Marinovum algicola]